MNLPYKNTDSAVSTNSDTIIPAAPLTPWCLSCWMTCKPHPCHSTWTNLNLQSPLVTLLQSQQPSKAASASLCCWEQHSHHLDFRHCKLQGCVIVWCAPTVTAKWLRCYTRAGCRALTLSSCDKPLQTLSISVQGWQYYRVPAPTPVSVAVSL